MNDFIWFKYTFMWSRVKISSIPFVFSNKDTILPSPPSPWAVTKKSWTSTSLSLIRPYARNILSFASPNLFKGLVRPPYLCKTGLPETRRSETVSDLLSSACTNESWLLRSTNWDNQLTSLRCFFIIVVSGESRLWSLSSFGLGVSKLMFPKTWL